MFKPSLKTMGISFAALVALTVGAISAGNWSTLPIVGGSSFCVSTVTGASTFGGATGQGQATNGSICAQTVPAGPTNLTGSELIPADTQLGGGSPPQTVTIPSQTLWLQGGGYVVENHGTGTASTLVSPNVSTLIIDASGAKASMGVSLPVAPVDGQIFRLGSTQTLTTLTISPTSPQTVKNTPTAMTASSTGDYGYTFIYKASNTTWYRLQ